MATAILDHTNIPQDTIERLETLLAGALAIADIGACGATAQCAVKTGPSLFSTQYDALEEVHALLFGEEPRT